MNDGTQMRANFCLYIRAGIVAALDARDLHQADLSIAVDEGWCDDQSMTRFHCCACGDGYIFANCDDLVVLNNHGRAFKTLGVTTPEGAADQRDCASVG